MQDMLKKIIEMDEQARLVKEQAQKDKAATEQEIIETKKKIYDDYIERAKDRVRKNLEVNKEKAEKQWEETAAKHQQITERLVQMDKENHETWVDEIVKNVIEN
ncbi:MAG: hypothetical protein IJO20_01880 [Ruminococcus sp.]|nr:hypothetical protein [Ruminococcus sp.]MBQ7133227.1 hypothetical protein [Ruminococcus sp.]